MWYKFIVVFTLFFYLQGCQSELDEKHILDIEDVLDMAKSNMVYVESGEFMLGVQDESLTNISEYRNDKVIKISSYYISKYETTWFEYVTFLKDIGLYETDRDAASLYRDVYLSEELSSPKYKSRPALAVSWESANDYCKWLGVKTGIDFSMPTEAQWEYAARSRGKKVLYAAGDGFDIKIDRYMHREFGYRDEQTNELTPQATDPLSEPYGHAASPSLRLNFYRIVGSYPPNPLGLYDMTGNAREWVSDWYDKNAYDYMSLVDPQGPLEMKVWVKDIVEDKVIPAKTVRDWLSPTVSEGGVYSRGKGAIDSKLNGFRCVKNI